MRAPPTDPAAAARRDMLRGLGLSALGYALFAMQDAAVKWLVERNGVPEILLVRSLVIVAIAAIVGGRGQIAAVARSPRKGALVARAGLILVAWLTFYSAARHLGLAELTTLYFAAPLVAVALAVVVLKERVGPARWVAVLAGFGGVMLAAAPSGAGEPIWVGMALVAAGCWGLSVVLVRLISRSETTANQMLVSNAVFALACAGLLAVSWHMPSGLDLVLMVGIGLVGGLGQFALYEGFRLAPASVVAPVEYTGLVWAFLYGFLIWAEAPRLATVAGAAVIVASSLGLIWYEGRGRPVPA